MKRLQRFVVLESEDSGEVYSEALLHHKSEPIVRGMLIAPRYFDIGETLRVGVLKCECPDDAMSNLDNVDWMDTFTVLPNDEEE